MGRGVAILNIQTPSSEGVVLDKQRTDRELDALADLYLTDIDQPGKSSQVPEALAIGAQREAIQKLRQGPSALIADIAPSISTRSAGLMTQPPPARLLAKVPTQTSTQPGPPVPVSQAAAVPSHPQDDQTALTHPEQPLLRLVNHELETAMASLKQPATNHAESPPTEALVGHTSHCPVIELDQSAILQERRAEVVFLGNLPGFASPWMTQYAQHVALECGIVGILHVDDEQIDLDFVTTPANRNQLDAVHQQVMDFEQADNLIAVLDLLNQNKKNPVGAWLIHLATPLTDTTGAIARSLPVWTLLSGADETAGARAMAWLKQCLPIARPKQMDHVQFMAMGCDIDRAVSRVRQIDDHALEQYDTTVELVGVQRQMVPVHLQTLGSFPTLMEQWPVVVRLIAGLASAQDHRQSLVTRIDPVPAQSDQQLTQTSTDSDDNAQQLLMTARLEAINLPEPQPPEPPEAPPPEPPELPSPSPEPPTPWASSEARVAQEDAQPSAAQEIQETLVSPQAPESLENASDVVLEPEVVSDTVQQFVQRLKQQELRKRQQEAVKRDKEQPPVEPLRVSEPQTQPLLESEKPTSIPDPLLAQVQQEPQDVYSATAQSQTSKPPLVSYLQQAGTAGGIRLAARCPEHCEVELVLDEAGGLHLLAEHQRASGQSIGDALYALLDARGWVDQHISLLSLTQKQLRFDMQIRPVVHLFTDDARGGASVVANCARFVKIHLLAEVSVGSETAYYCTELN